MLADKIHYLQQASPETGTHQSQDLSLRQRMSRLYHTLRPLRWQQYWYRAWYPLKKIFYRPAAVPLSALAAAQNRTQAALFALPPFDKYEEASGTFHLLNIRQNYPAGNINWDDTKHGLLWTYHLNYFNWLEDEHLTVTAKVSMIRSYCDREARLKVGKDSYPVSLRSINWIRFFIREGICDAVFDRVLYRHVHRLYHFPEYHIQANHLWENGCALVFAGQYFKEQSFYNKGRHILSTALDEQVLNDGGHVEGSPMYHSLLLCRLLQCIEWLECGPVTDHTFIEKIRGKAALMLGWLQAVTFSDGHWAHVNDSTNGIAPPLYALRLFADKLLISPHPVKLSGSGYRMLRTGSLEVFIDIGNIQPAWQPGHTHADTFSFCVWDDGKPVLIDPGISTYEQGLQRETERSTDVHNTVNIMGKNSSDVWKSFRVGQRAHVTILEENEHSITAVHDGYRKYNIFHIRSWSLGNNKILLKDKLNNINDKKTLLNLHLHPDMIFKKIGEFNFLAGNLLIKIEHAQSALIEPYRCATGFNEITIGQRLHIEMSSQTVITIEKISC